MKHLIEEAFLFVLIVALCLFGAVLAIALTLAPVAIVMFGLYEITGLIVGTR